MGTVYRAFDLVERRAVAVKVLHGESAVDAERFAREQAILAELSHPAIVRYVAHGRGPDGEPVLVMDWIDGESLAARLAGAGLTVAEAVEMAGRAAGALGAAHARGIVHRDIKPSNLLFPEGRIAHVVVIDFGVARRTDPVGALTRTGVVVGTPGYMSPEQARGARAIDARSDVFSLGCVLYESLTGVAPFAADGLMALQAKIALSEPAPLESLCPEAPAGLRELCARMLAKAATDRPADGGAVAAALDGLGPLPESPRRPAAAAALPTHPVGVAVTGSTAPEAAAAVAVVLAAVEELGTRPTVTPGASELRERALAGALAPFRARLAFLGEGALVAAVLEGAPAELAARAARAALAMREVLPDSSIALTIAEGSGGLDAVLERAARGLERQALAGLAGGAPAAAVIRVDAATAARLGDSFDLRAGAGGAVLVGERRG
jgi:hypothetical protein